MSISEDKSRGYIGPNVTPVVENSHCLTPGYLIIAVNQLYMMSRCIDMHSPSTDLALACQAEYKSVTQSASND
jgi:hypothetical protein